MSRVCISKNSEKCGQCSHCRSYMDNTRLFPLLNTTQGGFLVTFCASYVEEPENVACCAVTEVSRYDEPPLAEFMSSSIETNEVGFYTKNWESIP